MTEDKLSPYSGWLGTTLVLLIAGLICGWIWLREGWFHRELFQVAQAVWAKPPPVSFFHQLSVTLTDWRLFESTTSRLRPLSDFVEVIDAILRPWRLFGMHPSLTLSALLLAVGTAGAFYISLLHRGLSPFRASLFTLLLVVSIGYLSCFVPYIRPAKKIALFFTALVLLFSAHYQRTGRSFPALCLSLFAALFADEAGFLLWPVAVLLNAQSLLTRKHWGKIIVLGSLPFIYLAAVKLLVPHLYALLGVPRRMELDAVGKLLAYLSSPRFYGGALSDLASGLLATLGLVGSHGGLRIFALLVVAGAIFLAVRRAQWDALATIAALIVMSLGLSLFDWFNTPFGSNPLGDLTFYYHSPVAVLTLFALAHVRLKIRKLVPIIAIVACLNIWNFEAVNRGLMIMHTFPTDTAALPRDAQRPAELEAEFWDLLPRFEGLEKSWYERTFSYYKEHPMGGASYVQQYNQMFHPR